ncbi:MAG: GspE/PulE family protein [Peptostreptococcaceae bacterium]|nr:GspE/PulE family protein [Peptostreptococcaceae bacterium]
MNSNRIRIGDKLVQYGYITEEQLQKALIHQGGTGKRIGEILIEQGLITAELLTNALTELLNIDNIDLTPSNINPEAIQKIPQNICKRYNVFPYKIENGKLYLAMEDPQDREAIRDVKRIAGMEIDVKIATISEINQAIEQWYSNTDLDKVINEYAKNEAKNTIEEEITGDEDVNSAPVVRLVHNILETAVRKKVSDIHIEHDGDYMRVRYRIDGILMEHMKASSKAYKAIISRIKIMANLNISEKRLPQDGRIYLVVDNKSVDFRVSTMPTSRYEKVVMRVLDKSNFMVSKEKLGFSLSDIKIYDDLLSKPYGLILVVGPTGSGKTTTLYSMLNQLNDVEKNILTIEDPVEYELQGINQSQINYKAGLDFASALRAFLRQDPDIIMVGEIRDHDTAEIAIRASLTGHLVLSTLHANTAVGAISRLSDMGMDSFLITSSLVGVVAQRLVRKICPLCKASYEASIGEKKALGYDIDKNLTLYKGEGCNKCNNTGYKGRLGIYEMIQATKPIKDLIDQGAKEDEIMKKANKLGMITMRQDAANKAIDGLTTVEEMIRVTFISE